MGMFDDDGSDLAPYDDGMYGANASPFDADGNFIGNTTFGNSNQNPASQGGSLLQKLLGGGGKNQADIAQLLGAFSKGEKANRIDKGNFVQNYDRNMLAAQAGRNTNESDALTKLAQTSYIMGGGAKAMPKSLNLGGKEYALPDLGYGPPAITDAEKEGATALQSQLKGRLSPGGSYTPQPLSSYANPGTAENIGSYGALGVGALGGIAGLMGGDGDASGGGGSNGLSNAAGIAKGVGGAASSIAGMMGTGGSGGEGAAAGMGGMLGTVGKFAGPAAGAALGTYGVVKNNSVGSDTMSGLGAGASIGSMVMPGIGTAVGAGVGALVGALRGAFSVTGKEKDGRAAQAQITQNLSKLATPQQIADSKKAGWPDPNQALALIVMRDKLTQSGVPGPQAEAQAESLMHSMWDNEKHGSSAVTQAASPIANMMGGSAGAPSPITGGSQYPAGFDAFSQGAYRG